MEGGQGGKGKMDKQTHLYVVAYPTAKLSCWDGLTYCSSALLTGYCWRTSVPGWAQIYVIGLLCVYTHTVLSNRMSDTAIHTQGQWWNEGGWLREEGRDRKRKGGRGTCASWINVITTPTTNQLVCPITEEIYLCVCFHFTYKYI